MKFSSFAVVASIAAAVSAQSMTELPECALACVAKNLPSTGCAPTDLFCACSNSKFISDSAACIPQSCPPADQQRAHSAAVALCKANGVTISTALPSSPATTTGASVTATSNTTGTAGTITKPITKPITTSYYTTVPTTGFAGNRTNTTKPIGVPTNIANAAERLTTALSLVGLSIAATYFSL
ncbi:hypothetical protein C7212DRAFT_362954 [Tuber magnatum]|uniref:CFEM domain-containing protein n=1 Tax=Tuber magnatum TaxID=42249 RepID=A0A317SVP2_9PEZI|nr:hypothetical protein C7212DRAFT_362954 [Tuber magnatum]